MTLHVASLDSRDVMDSQDQWDVMVPPLQALNHSVDVSFVQQVCGGLICACLVKHSLGLHKLLY